ncbi:hypothetical protein ACJRO7_015112 [Eucalyptus globulus]|uniref:LysM domain-containing protein n=1 Tax=Eucalyptus globulus TaxID=34317 RepID=A0ABD3L8A9_EUCGL
MAKITSHKSTIFFNLVSILLFVLMVTWVKSLIVGREPFLLCHELAQVNSEDTCYAIAQQYESTLDTLYSINPNVNCDDLSIGQYLCVSGEWF